MNKKSKRITLGLVSALCLLLVVALGFGVTGAWYRARRQATGTIKLDKGIELVVTNLGTGSDLTDVEQLSSTSTVGQLWVLTADGTDINPLTYTSDGAFPVSTEPGATASKNVVIPTIAAASGSTKFYAKAKLVYTFKAFGEDNEHNRIVANTVYNAEDLFMTDASTTNVLDVSNGIFSNQLTFNASAWATPTAAGMGNGYYLYTAGDAEYAPEEITSSTAAISLFTAETPANDVTNSVSGTTVDVLTLREWTGGNELAPANYVEFGGPKVYYRTNSGTDLEPNYSFTQIEIAQINVQVIIDVIQSENLTDAALTAWKAAA